MKTLVVGASHKPERYSNMAVNLLREYNHEVVALGRRAVEVGDWQIVSGTPEVDDLHTITLYLSAKNQVGYYDYFKSLQPERIIVNPGAENPELFKIMQEQGTECIEACTLVMLRTNQY